MRRPSRTTAAAVAVAAVVVVVGTVVRARTGGLGTATPPFVMAPGLRVHPLALPAAAVLAAAVLVGPRLLGLRRGFGPAAFALALACGVATGTARRGPDGLARVFDLGEGGSFQAKNEYLPGLPALRDGAVLLLDRFAELVPSQTVNVGGHPPGLLLTMHALGIETAGALAALCITAAAAVAPAAWALGRALGVEERRARTGALLAALSPGLLLFGVTSADAVFAALAVATAALLVARRTRPLGCAALAVAAFFTWANLAVAAFATVVAWRREGLRAAARLAAGCAAATLALNAALAAATGYDPIGALRATEELYRLSVASERPYWFWALGSVVAWGVTAGATTLVWLRATTAGHPGAVALAVVVAVAALLGFTTAETERIWLPFTGLACAAAAAVVPPERLRALLAALAVQALLTQLLFETIW